MADYQGIFGGGSAIASVVGGTAISVDNTDPLNPVINCTFVAPVTSVNGLTGPVTLTAASVGAATTSHTHAASDVTSGVFNVARLGTGTANNTVYLRGDGTWVGIDGGHITTGTVGTARLGSGTANNTTFLRGDGTWATPSGGITGFTSDVSTSSPNQATWSAVRLQTAHAGSNNDIVLQAKGTGAHLAQTPDSTTTGGNKRGEYAVDWQKLRSSGADRVASGNYAVVGGGQSNMAAAPNATVAGGQNNRVTAVGSNSTVAGGTGNVVNNSNSYIGGGSSNVIDSGNTTIGGGSSNSTSAQGTTSTIAGGQLNVASANYVSIGGGYLNQVSGYAGTIAGGYNNTASSNYAVVVGGQYNTASGPFTQVLGGESNQAAHSHATVIGGRYGKTLTQGSWVYANHYNWSAGDAQFVDVLWTARTTNSTPTTITIMGGLAQGVSIPTLTTATFQIQVAARQLYTTNIAGWTITGVVANISGVITLYNVTVNLIHRSVGTWAANVVADNTNLTLNLQVTGDNGNNIQWVANGRFTYCTLNG